jgi:mycothiol system anti-sigma-R factor
MSCGHAHEVDCSVVLDRVYEYIDNEMGDDDCATVKNHLDECAPCLAEFGLEQAVKSLVQRSCGCDLAPQELRAKVLAKIQRVREDLAAVGTAGAVGADAGRA